MTQEEADDVSPAPPPPARSDTGGVTPPAGGPLRVLYVEHTDADVELAVAELRRSGFSPEVRVAATPAEFTAALAEEMYDVILADYRLPGWTGLEALEMLQQSGRDIPFILVTGTLGEEAAVDSIKRGVSDYVLKGHLARLPMAVRRALRDKELRDSNLLATAALADSEARYRSLVENSTYGIYRVTPEGRFLDANPALVAMLGYDSREELMAVNIADQVFKNPDDRAVMHQMYLEHGRVTGMEVDWKRKDGRGILVRLSGRALKTPDGSVREAEVIAEDITERRALERQLHTAQKYEAIGQLAGGVAHDFNNVIGAVLGWAELGLDDAPADSPVRSHLSKIRDQAQRAAALTRQLLAFARKQTLQPRSIEINRVVQDVLGLLENVIGKDIEIRTRLGAGLDLVRADPTQLEQVLMNLCLNARDAMPGGGTLTIETHNVNIDAAFCRRYPYALPGRYVLLSVSDTGTGMDAATLDHIFEPFFTTKRMGKGTGLGLATVYGIVKQHGGIIHVYSEPGHGSCFKVYLQAAAAKAASGELPAAPAAEPARGAGETILVAEDHEGIRGMAREMLERFGYRVALACDGEEAVRVFSERSGEIALALLDVIMPRRSGPDAYQQMSALRPGLPVIFVTGYSAESTAQLRELARDGAIVLQKPYDPGQLARKVREALDARRAPGG